MSNFIRKQKVKFLNPHTKEMIDGYVLGIGVQPMSNVRIVNVQVHKGPEKGMSYWVPEKDVNNVLDWLAAL